MLAILACGALALLVLILLVRGRHHPAAQFAVVLLPAILVALFGTWPALAADDSLIDLRPVIQVVIELLAAVLLAGGGWALRHVLVRLGIQNEIAIRDRLHEAAERAIDYGREKAVQALATGDVGQIDVRSEVIAQAGNYLTSLMPDAVRRFGLTPEAVQQLVEAKLAGKPVEAPAR